MADENVTIPFSTVPYSSFDQRNPKKQRFGHGQRQRLSSHISYVWDSEPSGSFVWGAWPIREPRLTFSWSAVSNATSYDYGGDLGEGTTTGTSVGISHPTANTRYRFTVKAICPSRSSGTAVAYRTVGSDLWNPDYPPPNGQSRQKSRIILEDGP